MLASFLAASALGLAVPSVLLPNTVWRLQLDVGRHEGVGTWMPSEWAASGERLKIFDVSVEFGDEVCTAEFNERRLNGLGTPEDAYRLRVLSPGRLNGADGSDVKVEALNGAWSRVAVKGEYRLRFFIDFPEGATRGDVELPADRIFFTSRSGLAQVGQASGLGLTKEGVLNVKRERTLLKALSELGRSPKIQWGEAMFTVGLFTMEPIAAEAEQNDAEAA